MSVDTIARSLQRIRLVVYLLIGLVLVMGVGLTVLGVHVLARQNVADARNALADKRNRTAIDEEERNREAVCTVLRSIPAARRSRPVRDAIRLDDCSHAGEPSPNLQTVPSTSGTPRAGAGPVVVFGPSSEAPVRRRAPTLPAPHRTPQRRSPGSGPTPAPSPRPSPSRTCLLTVIGKCV